MIFLITGIIFVDLLME